MHHNVAAWKSERGVERGFCTRTAVLRTDANVTEPTLPEANRAQRGPSTLVLAARGLILGVALPQNVVQTATRGEEPLDRNVGSAPLLLEVGLHQVGDSFHEVYCTTVPESQPWIPLVRHGGILA